MFSDIDNLVERFRGGDQFAFRELVEYFQGQIRGLILLNGVNEDAVDDVAQATFIYVFQNMNKYELGSNFSAWLKTIARFKAKHWIDANQREMKNKNDLIQYLGEFIQDKDHDEEIETKKVKLAQCMQKINQPLREMIQKRYEGISLREIAEQYQMTESALKMTLLRIRKKLKLCVSAGS